MTWVPWVTRSRPLVRGRGEFRVRVLGLTVLPRASAGSGRCRPNDSQSRDLTLPATDAVTRPRFRCSAGKCDTAVCASDSKPHWKSSISNTNGTEHKAANLVVPAQDPIRYRKHLAASVAARGRQQHRGPHKR